MDELTDDELKLIRTVQLLSTKEVADRAGLAESSIRTYRTRGQLPDPDVTIGTTSGWLPQTIDPWIANNVPGRGARTDLRAADRALLRTALVILIRPGATSARTDQIAQGLKDGVDLAAIAQRVKFGADHLTVSDDVNGEERDVIERAYGRALTILDEPRQEELRRRLGNALRRHYGFEEES